ncbi:unnamed protein product, partial [Symbiodinium microadriaticum]
EALAYLRRHQTAQPTPTTTGGKSTASTTRGTTTASTTRSTKRTLTTSTTRGQPKQDPTRPRQPRAQSSSSSSSSSDNEALAKAWPNPCRRDLGAHKTRSSNKKLGPPSSATCPAETKNPGEQKVTTRPRLRGRHQQHNHRHPRPMQPPTWPLQPGEFCGDCPPSLLVQPEPCLQPHLYL